MTELPPWLTTLADAAARHITPVEPLAPLGCHCHLNDGIWEVSLFAGDTEIVGGSNDGQRCPSRFVVDIMPILCLFSDVYDCTWQPARFTGDDELGAHLDLLGTCSGQLVSLRVLSRAPRRFPPGRRANVYDGAWEELW